MNECLQCSLNILNYSKFSDFYREILPNLTSQNNLNINVSFGIKRLIAQLRLSHKYNIYILVNKIKYTIDTTVNCMVCNRQETENLYHLLFVCPIYQSLRRVYLAGWFQNDDINVSNYYKILTNLVAGKINSIFYFVVGALKLRSFCLYE